jgi:IMP dehydrogenase
MAVALAEEGGLGVIDRGFAPAISARVAESRQRISTAYHRRPHVQPTDRGGRVRVMERTQSTRLSLSMRRDASTRADERDVRFARPTRASPIGMTGAPACHADGSLSLAEAEQLMIRHKVKKLPLVNAGGTLLGLITAKDLIKHRQHPFATRDPQGRLCVGAAVGATGDYLERAAEVVRAGADVLVIDIAHGHSKVMERAIEQIRRQHAAIDVVAGNVATADGARFLAERPVNGIKVGIGPGGDARRDLRRASACRRSKRSCSAASPSATVSRSSPTEGFGRWTPAEALLFGGDTACWAACSRVLEGRRGVAEVGRRPESQKTVQVPFKVLRMSVA